MPTTNSNAYPGTPGTTLYAGLPNPSGALITTLSLVNTSGSTQSANFVSPMLGMPFKQGDVPSGQYPQFQLTDNTPCPATIWGVTSWPDGSMKFCGAMIRVPTTIAGSGTLTINVKNGGTAPAASSRGTSDFTAADLKTELTGVTNLSGVWTASLNTAITDATEISVIGDGPAGKVYRIRGAYKQSGAAHGQLVCYHYVAALQNSAGGLLGLRYLGRVAQPWGDVSSPTATVRVATGVLKSGASTLRTLQGTHSGETVDGNIDISHYTSFFTCGADGKWDYVQGGGSVAADCTVRAVQNRAYFVKSKLVPPYDLTISPTSLSSIDYVPYCKGPSQLRDMGSGGPRVEIGVLPDWSARHIVTQSANDERNVRVGGLASGGWVTCVRRSTTGQPVPVVDVSASYTGLGTVQTTWRYAQGTQVGFVAPAASLNLWDFDYESSHRPSATYYPYLLTGEPQYLDMLAEQAAEIISTLAPGGTTYNVGSNITSVTGAYGGDRNPSINGTTYKGAGLHFRTELYRVMAWASRDVAQGAAIYPDTCPYGTELRKYLREVIESNYSATAAYNNALPTTWRDDGLWTFQKGGVVDADFDSPWALCYLSISVCHQASILGSTSGAVAFRQHLAKFYAAVHTTASIGQVASYRMVTGNENGRRAEQIEDVTFVLGYATITFSTSTNRGTLTGVNSGWSPTNGDVFVFDTAFAANKPFAAAVDQKQFFAVNCSGKTFQLAATPGGAPITVTYDGDINVAASVQNLSGAYAFEPENSTEAYPANLYAALRIHEACGDSVVNGARVEQDANIVTGSVNFANAPKNAMAVAYPV